eukprot:Nitzschia sp. Nitz4//scaffold76_size158648//89748//92025//NITZ4_002553-RA/size158648-processed-gene-0.241-mRNA-1//1//CDS//3329557866//4487//frame0
MLLEAQHWHFGYEQIKTDCQASDEGLSVLMLCNADVDAMASARILSYMFRSDGIHYQLLPCTNYTVLDDSLRNCQLETVRAIVLLNFGASRNLTRLLDDHPDLHPSTKLYVLDCRRPIHLANIYAGNNVVVFYDGTQSNEHVPSDGDDLSGNDSSSAGEESSDDDSSDEESDHSQLDDEYESEEEAKFEDIDGQVPVKDDTDAMTDKQESDYDAEDESEIDESPNLLDSENSPKKRQRTEENPADDDDGVTDLEQSDGDTPPKKRMSPREMHRDRRERLRAYYTSGTYFGSPAAFIAYQIASQHRFGDQGDLLWLACVGVTDAYLHTRIDMTGYAELAMGLRQSCLKLYPSDLYERAVNTVYAEDLAGRGEKEGKTKITLSDNGRIVAEKDYRFFLLRHSSLFDSMVHSEYISTKMQVWTKNGMHKLQELLAKMGYPLEECRQPFAYMKPNLRRRLHEKIMSHAEDYGLQNFEFTSFFRVTGYQSLLSASDTSYGVTALLEFNTSKSDWNESMSEAFHVAYDALNPNVSPSLGWNGLSSEGHDTATLVNGGSLAGTNGIGAGIRLAIAMQRSIISTAVGLADRNAIHRLRHFRYAYLTCTSAGENRTQRSDLIRDTTRQNDESKDHLFAKPLALSRLAHYLMSMHRENGKWAGPKSRPLVLLAEKPQTGTYLVVGYESSERAGMLTKNKFGMNFELTAQSMNGTFRFDSFDSNVVEVNGSDVQRFIEQLHYLMDSI